MINLDYVILLKNAYLRIYLATIIAYAATIMPRSFSTDLFVVPLLSVGAGACVFY
jgi:hypothetical protein